MQSGLETMPLLLLDDVLIDISLSNFTNVSPFEVYQEVTHSINQMVEKITIYTMTADTLGSYKLVLNKQNLERNVVPGYHRSLGRCHTLSLQEAIQQRGIRYVELKM